MANESEQQVRSGANVQGRRDPPTGRAVEIPERGADADQDQGHGPADLAPPPGVPEVPVESDEERVARERVELIAAADGAEIVDGGESTTAYRRASAVFDPEDDQVQLAEHYHFRSADFERHGRF